MFSIFRFNDGISMDEAARLLGVDAYIIDNLIKHERLHPIHDRPIRLDEREVRDYQRQCEEQEHCMKELARLLDEEEESANG